ncbi:MULTISPECIES: hypothetical protein [Thermus]|jgi:chemotaxis regulatin CheY-phosphate phosphatase CheZ|uniref:CopG family transcriptional regulator n=1 Tax=Thermus brockianus TaxID=56956 RepID=A0ABM7XML0_THEBO|nr:hypothetical protein [Thermus brockianus]BDG17616.1 hypothetical protein TbrSNM41_23500 [Thermus brockianus]
MALPTDLEKELERSKKSFGPGWDRYLRRLLREEIRRKEAKKKLADFMRRVSGRSSLTEEEIFARLEGRT